MQDIFTNIKAKIRIFCKPDPKFYPDPSVQEITWDRNLMNFYALLFSTIAFIIFSISFKLPSFVIMPIVGSNTCGFLLFCLFCRSRAWIYHYGFTVIMVAGELRGLETFQETAYFHIGHVFLSLTLSFIMTGEPLITFGSVIVQSFVLVTRFTEKITILILEEGPEVFADKFVKNTLTSIILLIVINVTLAKMLEKRTRELSRARIAIENAMEQQKTFIFSFSHELRNPINSLLGNLQLVLQDGDKLSPKAKEMINIAKICGELLLHNINNVLDTGKHEIGKLEVNPTPTQLNELFQKTWGIYSELFRQKKLKGQLKVEKDIPPVVKIDSHKVNQILLNLIGNSIKFTERGTVSVTVKWLHRPEINAKCFEPLPYDDIDEGLFEKEENLSTINTSIFSSESRPRSLESSDEKRRSSHQERQESKGVLKIVVKDTGSGMKSESLEKLFQKFSQVSEHASQRQIGTGLGLFITREICHAMNGEIRAFSKFNKGTTIIVCIPTISVPMNSMLRADSGTILHQLSTKHLKALVADDSPFNVNLICNYFAKFEAYVVSTAYNGSDIFTKYKECKLNNVEIDIVTLDIDMPILDGRKTCDKIREYEKENRMKPTLIILISGNYDQEQIEEYLNPEKGRKADCFLRKPVSFSEFHRAVYSLLVSND